MHCYPLTSLGINASVIDDIYSQMKAYAYSIVNMINYQYTDLEDHFTVGQYRKVKVAEDLFVCLLFNDASTLMGH